MRTTAIPTLLAPLLGRRHYTIDHFLLSAGLRLEAPPGSAAVELERVPASPYAPSNPDQTAPSAVVAASDHVWQSIRVVAS